MKVIATTSLPLPAHRRGKVRDVYELGDDRLLLVATDRVSAFDVVMRETVPFKGIVLTVDVDGAKSRRLQPKPRIKGLLRVAQKANSVIAGQQLSQQQPATGRHFRWIAEIAVMQDERSGGASSSQEWIQQGNRARPRSIGKSSASVRPSTCSITITRRRPWRSLW